MNDHEESAIARRLIVELNARSDRDLKSASEAEALTKTTVAGDYIVIATAEILGGGTAENTKKRVGFYQNSTAATSSMRAPRRWPRSTW